jgi:hypothetical protein
VILPIRDHRPQKWASFRTDLRVFETTRHADQQHNSDFRLSSFSSGDLRTLSLIFFLFFFVVIPSITKHNHKRTKNKQGRFLPSQIVQKLYKNKNGDDLNRLFFWFIITGDYLELNPVAVKDCHHQVTTKKGGCLVFLVGHRHHDVIRLVY